MLDVLPASNDITRYVIIITFLFITFYSIRMIMHNMAIYRFLKGKLFSSEQNGEGSEFWSELKQQYDKENISEKNHIDVQAFVESYMSKYSLPLQATSILNRVNHIQSAPSTVILIGVLGTFVGLISALAGLNINGQAFQSSIQNVLDGIYTAFLTSVCGIAASLIITFVHRNWDAKHLLLQLTLKAENLLQSYAKHTWESRMVDSLHQVKTAIKDMHQSLRELDQFTKTMEEASNNMLAYNEKFQESATILHDTFVTMDEASNIFKTRMDTFTHRFDQFIEQVEKQEHALENIDTHIQGVTNHVSGFVERTGKQIDQLIQSNQAYHIKLEDKLTETFDGITNYTERQSMQLDQIVKQMEQLERKNQTYIQHVGKATDIIQEVLKDRSFDQLLQVTKNFAENVMILESHFQRLQDQYTRLDQEKQEFSRHYQQQKDELSKLREEIRAFSSHNEGIRRQFEDIRFLFEKADQSNREVVQQTYGLIREVKDALKQSQQDQSNQLNQSIQMFTQQLRDSFQHLDQILSRNLSNSMEKFEQYVTNTNQAMERQFAAIQDYVNNDIRVNQSVNQEVVNAVGDIRNRIDQWDNQMRQSVRTIPHRENRG